MEIGERKSKPVDPPATPDADDRQNEINHRAAPRLPDPPPLALHPDAFKNPSLIAGADDCATANPTPRPAAPHKRGEGTVDQITYGCSTKDALCLTEAEQANIEAWRQGQCRDTGNDPFRFRDVDPNASAIGVDHAALARARFAADMEQLTLMRTSPAAAAAYSLARVRGVDESDARAIGRDTAVVAGVASAGLLGAAGVAKMTQGPRPGTTTAPAPTRPARPPVTTPPARRSRRAEVASRFGVSICDIRCSGKTAGQPSRWSTCSSVT